MNESFSTPTASQIGLSLPSGQDVHDKLLLMFSKLGRELWGCKISMASWEQHVCNRICKVVQGMRDAGARNHFHMAVTRCTATVSL